MTALPRKRFYQEARAEARADGVAVLLDGKPLLTPARRILLAPTEALGTALAAEWARAGDRIDIADLALTRLSMTAQDHGDASRAPWTDEIMKFAGSDLLCYRAAEPDALIRRQEQAWSPFLRWTEAALGARFRATTGIAAIAQPEPALAAVGARLAALNGWRLLGVRRATEISGSAILALALEAGAFPPAEIVAAARLDETFQAERWGVDAEAAAREARIRRDFFDAARFLELLAR
jgi:chaperone required for assembly of F1-ATPase